MIKTIKIVLGIVFAVVFIVIAVFHALFTWGLPPDDKVFNSYEFMEEMGGGYDEVTYRLGEYKKVKLLLQFHDSDFAVQQIKKHLRGFLLELSLRYSLPEFSPETFDLYQESLLKYREDSFMASKRPVYKLSTLSYFFQIYANTETNIKVLEESGMKSNVDSAMNVLFTKISTGYRIEENSVIKAERLVNELVFYMKDTFSLVDFNEETLSEYREKLKNVPDDLFGIDKEILERFIDIYTELKNS